MKQLLHSLQVSLLLLTGLLLTAFVPAKANTGQENSPGAEFRPVTR